MRCWRYRTERHPADARPGRRPGKAGLAIPALLSCVLLCGAARAGVVEVLHSWDGEFDGAALAVLRDAVTRHGHTWKDFTVVGGGGNGMATALLESRVSLGNPPSVAQVRTPDIMKWARQGALASVDEVARAENWDAQLPAPVRKAVQYQGRYIAVPVNVHRLNWLWVNADILKRVGATAPTTWDEFFDTAEKLKRAGYVAVAHGGELWQDHMLFQTVVLGVGGAEFYARALVDFDPAALSGETMVRALTTFRRIKQFTQGNRPSTRWIRASESVIEGKAGMQFMGDWAKPVFRLGHERKGLSFDCVPAPGTAKFFLFTTDSFAFFRLADKGSNQAQQTFASFAMSKPVQARFNHIKGSIPALLDVESGPGDRCGEISSAAYRQAAKNDNLIPGMAMSVRPDLELAIPSIISEFWRDDRLTPATTVARLVHAARDYR